MKDDKYSIYRTPFRLKMTDEIKRNEDSRSPPKQVINNYLYSTNYPTYLQNSPYTIRNASLYRTEKSHKTTGKQQTPSVNRCSSEMKLKRGSLFDLAKVHTLVEKQGTDEFQIVDSSKNKAKTMRKFLIKSASNQRVNLRSDLRFLTPSESSSKRRFIISVVNLEKERAKSRQLMNKKLETYNYKAVLGEALPFRTKKVPKIIISQDGTIIRERI